MIHHPRTFHFSSALQGFGFFLQRRRQIYTLRISFFKWPRQKFKVWIPAIFKGGGGADKNWKISLAMSIIVLKGTYRNGSIKTHNFMILESYETADWNLLLLLTSQSSDFSQLYGGHRTYM